MDSSNFALGSNRASRLNKTLYSLPVHCLTADDLKNENAKGIMQHFHAPENEHNRFLASLTQQERAILRHIERPLPYDYKASKPGRHCWFNSSMPLTTRIMQECQSVCMQPTVAAGMTKLLLSFVCPAMHGLGRYHAPHHSPRQA